MMGAWAGAGNVNRTTGVNNTSGWNNQGNLGSVPANNPEFQGTSSSVVNKTSLALAESALSSARGAYTSNKVLTAISLISTAYDALSSIYNSLSSDDAQKAKAKMDELESEKKKLEEQKVKNEETAKAQTDLKDYTTRQQDAMSPPVTGETLPSVLTKNAKELVTSVNTLSTTLGEKFDYFNNYMYGFLTYMDIVVGFMDKTYTLNKELADNAKKKEDDNALQVGDTKMSPAEIEAQKNLAMWKNYAFQRECSKFCVSIQ